MGGLENSLASRLGSLLQELHVWWSVFVAVPKLPPAARPPLCLPRTPLPADHRGVSHEYFLGSGGVLGLLGSLEGRAMRGSGPAVAEANALHKGPVVFHIPQASS